MNFWKSLVGVLEVELTSAEPELALESLNAAGIELDHVQRRDPLTLSFRIRRTDFDPLTRLCKKRGETLKLLRKRGLYWAGARLVKRPVLLTGMVLLLGVILYLPSRVLFVRVEGNQTVPSRRILAAAEENGIGFGASRRRVRSEKVKNALLSAVPELQWAGVNTTGCVATISVRERAAQKEAAPQHEVTSIIAARDGYILSGTVTRGNAMFQVGQTVKAGQVLISGYTDCGICIQAARAEGEIFAETSHSLRAVTLSQQIGRGAVRDREKNISLLLGKKRINLWKDSGNFPTGCDRIDTQYTITLPGGFYLPVTLCVETRTAYEMEWLPLPLPEAEKQLTDFAGTFLSGQMVAGEILSRSETLFPESGLYSLEGEYRCTEMISRVRREQIGEENGETD